MSPLTSETTPTSIDTTPVLPLPGMIGIDDISKDLMAANDTLGAHIPNLLVRRRKRQSRRTNV